MPEKVKPFKLFFIHDSHHLRKNVKIIFLLFLNLTVAACIKINLDMVWRLGQRLCSIFWFVFMQT